MAEPVTTEPAAPASTGRRGNVSSYRVTPLVEKRVEETVLQLKRRRLTGSNACARATAELLRQLIGACKPSIPTAELLAAVRSVGCRLQAACPSELAIGNTVRRILRIIRVEHTSAKSSLANSTSGMLAELQADESNIPALYNMLGVVREDYKDVFNIKPGVLEEVRLLLEDFETITQTIASQAVEHIHANEVILTIGKSYTVLEFLKAAAKRKRAFQVIVAEAAPGMSGHAMAKELAEAGISATLITDSAVFALMARVHKVIIGTHVVTANGALLADAGTHIVTLAAKTHSVPVVVLTGLYKMCPLHSSDLDVTNDLQSPAEVMHFSDVSSPYNAPIILSSRYDLIQPDMVALFITNYGDHGSHSPSYIYRLLQELYDPEDYDLDDRRVAKMCATPHGLA